MYRRSIEDRNYLKLQQNLIIVTTSILLSTTLAASENIEEIQVTARRVNTQLTEVISAVSVLNSEQLRNAQAAIITDALQGSSGVFIQQTTPGQGTAIVRGLKGSEILHLVDGMRLNNALFRNAPNQYLALVDPWIVSQAEVVRGPLSTIYGSDAMGGVVHLITNRRDYESHQFINEFKNRLSFDSATSGRTYNSGFSRGKNNLSYGASFSYQDIGDLKAANSRVQSPSAYTSRAASLFTSYQMSNEHKYDFSIQYLEQPNTPRYDELVAGFGQSEASSEVFLFSPNSRLFVHAKHRSSGYNQWIKDLEIHLGLQIIRDGRRTQDYASEILRVEDNRSALLGLTLQGTSTELGRHELTYGVDLYHDQVSSEREQINVISNDSEYIQARFPDGSTLSNVDTYVHDNIQLNSVMQLDTGLRVSLAKVDLKATESSPQNSVSNFDISGSTGILYDFTDALSGIANIARGFRAPNIFDLGTLGVRPGNRFNIANPNLEPETVLTGELGLRLNKDKVSADIVFWTSDYQDKIVSVSTGVLDSSGRDIVQSQNASSVSLHGAEFSSKWLMNEFNSFKLNLTYTRGDTEFNSNEIQPADRIPPFNGQASWKYNNEKWWMGTEIQFASEQNRLSARDIRDPRINPLGTSGWGSVNLLWGIQFEPNWLINLRFNNVLDKAYRSHGSGIDSAGRHVKISLERKL